MNVIVVYHYFPHYRKGVFEELAKRYPGITFVSTSWNALEGIPKLDVGSIGNAVELPALEFGKMIYQVGLCRLIWKADYDVIIFLANPNFLSTWFSAICARLKGKRVIFWGHGFLKQGRGIKNLVRAIFFRLASASYVYGYGAKKNAMSLGFDPARIYVGFNSLDYSGQLKVRQELMNSNAGAHSFETGWLRILCVSRLTRICRYDLLIDAADLYSRLGYGRVQIDFIGEGPVEKELKERASERGVPANFHGAIYEENVVAGRIFSADVVVSPGKIGLTAIHSLMYGTPVITHGVAESQMPEFEAIVDGVTGLLYVEQSAEALCDCLHSFARQFTNREAVRSNCFRVVDEIYNPYAQVEVMERAMAGLPAAEGNDVDEIKWSSL